MPAVAGQDYHTFSQAVKVIAHVSLPACPGTYRRFFVAPQLHKGILPCDALFCYLCLAMAGCPAPQNDSNKACARPPVILSDLLCSPCRQVIPSNAEPFFAEMRRAKNLL